MSVALTPNCSTLARARGAASRRDHPRALAPLDRVRVSPSVVLLPVHDRARGASLRARAAPPGLDTLAAAPELFQLADGGFSPLYRS